MYEEDEPHTVEALLDPVLQPAASEGELASTAPTVPPLNLDAVVASDGVISGAQPSFVYGLGQIEPRFPSLGVEKEYAQVIGRRDDAGGGLMDRQLLVATLADPHNLYLARQMCWCFLVEGVETYILIPRDPGDYQLLIDAVRENPDRNDVDIVIGTRGGIAPPEMCNGLAIPVVVFDLIYSFDRESIVKAIPVPESVAAKDRASFRNTAGGFFDHVMKLADNSGATDDHRALNYLAARHPGIYALLAEQQTANSSLTNVDVRLSALSAVRRIVNVVFSFAHRQTGVATKYYLQVDVTEEWPFLVKPLSPYYDVR